MSDTIKIKEELEREWMWFPGKGATADLEHTVGGSTHPEFGAVFISHERDIPDTITGEGLDKLTRFIQKRRKPAENEMRTRAGHLWELRWHQGRKQFKLVSVVEWLEYGSSRGPCDMFTDVRDHERAVDWFERNQPKSKQVEFEGDPGEVMGFVGGYLATPGKLYRVTLEELDQ